MTTALERNEAMEASTVGAILSDVGGPSPSIEVSAQQAGPVKRTILVVEDEITIAELLKMLLEYEGYGVDVAGDGLEALARIGKFRPDLVLTDIIMPQMDGLELCRAIKSLPENQTIPVVLMSAASETVARGQCRYAAFLPKPFYCDELLNAIGRVLDGSRGAGLSLQDTV